MQSCLAHLVHYLKHPCPCFTTCVCTQLPASQPALVQALLSVSVHGVLSGSLLVSHSPVRIPSVLVGLQNEFWHAVLAGHGVTVLGMPVEPVGNPTVSGVPVCAVGS